MNPTIISLINLWCSKNLVDSQFLLWKYLTSTTEDVAYATDPYDSDVELVFLNTCGFISSGREEMFEVIEKLLSHNKKICIIWCAVQVFERLLNESSPSNSEIKKEQERRKQLSQDSNISFLSRNDLSKTSISDILNNYKSQTFLDFERLENPRALTNIDNKFEYIKIAEGCNNSCSFCIIPKIRGKQTSLPIEKVLQEVQMLLNQGVEEIILIAQDSTRYGMDLYGKAKLFDLLEKIEQFPGDFCYRVLYLYPDILTLHQLKKLTTFKKFIPYFDIPLQHISSPILKNMGRFYDEKMIYQFLDFIKSNFPEHFIRTNFIIGFPWETEKDVDKLHEFIQKDYFDNIALFEYHDEPLAESSKLPNKIASPLIRKRFIPLRREVNKILLKKHQVRKGNKEIWYIQEIHEKDDQIVLSVRPQLYCPELDGVDEININQIISSQDPEVNIATKVIYRV